MASRVWGGDVVRLKLILCVLVLAPLAMPVAADKVDDLILDLKFGSSDVRVEAAWALGEIGDARAVDPLIEALTDEYGRVRMSAAQALGEIGNQRAVGPLTEALKDESVIYLASSGTYERVREVVYKALEKIEAEKQ